LTPAGVCAFTCWRFGFHFFGEALCEWLTLCPKIGPFPQISHIFGMVVLFQGLFYTIKGPPAQHFKRKRTVLDFSSALERLPHVFHQHGDHQQPNAARDTGERVGSIDDARINVPDKDSDQAGQAPPLVPQRLRVQWSIFFYASVVFPIYLYYRYTRKSL
jgi:hypothetical protein